MFAAALMAVASSAQAQQVTGDARLAQRHHHHGRQTTPAPGPEIRWRDQNQASESKPWWAPRVVPPKGAPNVLLIMTDDCGFGAPGTFGGVVPTPALDRVAKSGLRYSNFHSTALCSPTRAALITGRNHHVAGFGVVGEITTGYPGYDSIILKANGTIGTILKDNGYATSWFGKEHNTPSYQATAAGPFDQWPVGMGFEYFYGFVGGDASQWQPNLFRNTTPIYPFEGKPPGTWNLTTEMANEAIQYMRDIKAVAPENIVVFGSDDLYLFETKFGCARGQLIMASVCLACQDCWSKRSRGLARRSTDFHPPSGWGGVSSRIWTTSPRCLPRTVSTMTCSPCFTSGREVESKW